MASLSKDDVLPARVISEDSDFMLLEVGKHDGVKFTLDENKEANRFEAIVFVQNNDGDVKFEKPWERDAG